MVGARFINSTSDKILANSLVSAVRCGVVFAFCLGLGTVRPCGKTEREEARSGVEERYGDGILGDKASVIKGCSIRCPR